MVACMRATPRIARGVAQIAHLAHQTAQKTPVETHIRVLQNEGGLAEPRNNPARQYVGPPGDRMPRTLQRDPLVDQRTRIGARNA
jgi:hypothetical protein